MMTQCEFDRICTVLHSMDNYPPPPYLNSVVRITSGACTPGTYSLRQQPAHLPTPSTPLSACRAPMPCPPAGCLSACLPGGSVPGAWIAAAGVRVAGLAGAARAPFNHQSWREENKVSGFRERAGLGFENAA